MQKKDCFLVGTVFKLHGYKGDVNIYNNNDILFDFNTIKYFLIEQNNSLVPFFISKARHTKENVILVSLEEINSEKTAKSLLKQKVYLPIEFLPENDENEISEKQLIGFKVQDINFGALAPGIKTPPINKSVSATYSDKLISSETRGMMRSPNFI